MKRRLSNEERELWDRVRQSAKPLLRSGTRRLKPALAAPVAEVVPEAVAARSEKVEAAAKPPQRPVGSRPKAYSPPLPSMAALETKARRRLARGQTGVDRRIDLHGMTQAQAHSALIGFLHLARGNGDRLVLVITGKGREDDADRGVLRRSVPHWLSQPELRRLVLGFEEASRRHGGAGALYVRLRRRSD
ncbi:DNA-nicking endonuclease, Smr domain [Faunimonas pinastri]|uniref:DNA-nicking endonuclease, Smr domain n=1 Tax=Faunimonas pinastri TaxID=1855383 RepID=A0A1H9GXN1_9HYPH|nr:Smr/MutS family protein [Faunimonas pinastri]SEQ54805.1 DNA-nicking endonuclease, Smr domain [Faunimonas pinastri]